MRCLLPLGIILGLIAGLDENAQAKEARLLRYPDIHDTQITFVFADKIWIANSDGRSPRALTEASEGTSRPQFSPDGSMIAYTAKSNGNYDVYSVPVTGGTPKRLTHHPARDYTLGWHPSGKKVLFASTMSSQRAVYKQLFTVAISGGLPQKIPLPYGESATFTQNGDEILFTYLRDFQEESWKRYYGGRAPDIWSYNLSNYASTQLTRHPASDSVPMQINEYTYFLSERAESGRSNIWRRDAKNRVSQVTHFTDIDVRRPSTDGRNIIFETGGDLNIFDPLTQSVRPVPLHISMQRKHWRPQRISVEPRISNAALGNDGKVLLEARGDIFAYDTKTDIVKNLTPGFASAERFPQISNDGKFAYISDRSGEYQVYIQSLDTSRISTSASPNAPIAHQAKRLTNFGAGLRYKPYWSPDGRKLAFIDHKQVIWLVDTKSGKRSRIDKDMWNFAWDLPAIRLTWSADNQWLIYSRGLENRNKAIFAYNVTTQKRHQLTSGAFSDFSPVFDETGHYILMLSHRNFQPTFGDNNIDATWTYTDSVSVSLLPLQPDSPTPDSIEWQDTKKRNRIDIDFSDIESRLITLSAAPGNIQSLVPTQNGYALLRGGHNKKDATLDVYKFGKSTPDILQTGARLSLIDSSQNTLLTRDGDKWFIIEAAKGSTPKRLQTDQLSARIDKRAEYKQMFQDAWRFARDFYYDPGLHGVDWKAEHARYGPLVDHAYVDSDMTYILRELMGELEGGHVYALGTAPGPRGDATNIGMLGIDFETSGEAYKIRKIYNSGPRQFEHKSPLSLSTLDVKVGDFILSVNGRKLSSKENPWAPFEGLAERNVELEIADTASGVNARIIKVKTLKSERKLRELAWVEDNRRKVEIASGGRIGYIYVPNTSREGLNELMIQYRSQFNKDALIIDERFNTGGALGDRFVELLNRPPLIWFRARNSTAYSLPELAHRGPKALLINGWSYSGGDGFPLLFKTAKIGPVIGTKTWGGLIGPGMFMPLTNGGFVSVPPIRVAGNDGQWSEGNEGVTPTLDVANDPGQLAKGIDQQLNRAIVEMMQALQNYTPVPIPEFQKAGEWNPAKREKK